jgi:hypothetical protein
MVGRLTYGSGNVPAISVGTLDRITKGMKTWGLKAG